MLIAVVLVVGSMRSKYIPEVGKKFGRWEVISSEIKSGSVANGNTARSAFWRVRCDCGKESWREAKSILDGKTNACKACCRNSKGYNSRILSFVRKFKRSADQRGIAFSDEITPDFIERMYKNQDGCCALSGVEISFLDKWKDGKGCSCSLDRIDSSKAYTPDNIHLVHKQVNMLKGSLGGGRAY